MKKDQNKKAIEVIIIDKSGKKKKSNDFLKDAEDSLQHINKATSTFLSAISLGIKEYRTSKSDDQEENFISRLGMSVSKVIKESSEIPVELAKAINTETTKKYIFKVKKVFK